MREDQSITNESNSVYSNERSWLWIETINQMTVIYVDGVNDELPFSHQFPLPNLMNHKLLYLIIFRFYRYFWSYFLYHLEIILSHFLIRVKYFDSWCKTDQTLKKTRRMANIPDASFKKVSKTKFNQINCKSILFVKLKVK